MKKNEVTIIEANNTITPKVDKPSDKKEYTRQSVGAESAKSGVDSIFGSLDSD